MYKYDTHVHTAPVSRSAKAGVAETVYFYREAGYDGIFITNMFLDGDIAIDNNLPYRQKLDFFLNDYFEAKRLGDRIGLKVFLGCEMRSAGTDFLVYGLSPEWYYKHSELLRMKRRDALDLLRENGAFTVQAHPFRERKDVEHIRLYPRSVDALETVNGCSPDSENEIADFFADSYGLLKTAGSDNHLAAGIKRIAGVRGEVPIQTEEDYGRLLKEGLLQIFTEDVPVRR